MPTFKKVPFEPDDVMLWKVRMYFEGTSTARHINNKVLTDVYKIFIENTPYVGEPEDQPVGWIREVIGYFENGRVVEKAGGFPYKIFEANPHVVKANSQYHWKPVFLHCKEG